MGIIEYISGDWQEDFSQPFIYNDDIFCNEGIDDLVEYIENNEEGVESLADDWTAKVELTALEPMIKFDKDWILSHIDDERIDEDQASLRSLENILDEYKDVLEEIATRIPNLYYGTRRYITITKQDLLTHDKPS